MDELRWTLSFDPRQLDSRFPFNDNCIRRELSLSDNDLASESVTVSASIEMVQRFLTEIRERVRGLSVEDQSISRDTYFCLPFRKFRDSFWRDMEKRPADSVPPLLRMSRQHDKCHDQLLAGATLWFDDSLAPSLVAAPEMDSMLDVMQRSLPKTDRSKVHKTWLSIGVDVFSAEVRFEIGRL